MPHKERFVHLHCHSEFSLLDGAGRIPDLIQAAKESGMHALALTDHGTMHGVISFFTTAKKMGVKPIIGCEVYVAPRTRFNKETKEDRSPYHLTVLAKDEQGELHITMEYSRPAWQRWLGADRRCERTFVLDGMGRQMYELCTGKNKVRDLVRIFSEKHQVSPAEAEYSVTLYLKTLIQKGLVVMEVDRRRN